MTDPIRPCTLDDLEEMVGVGLTSYAQRFPRMTDESLRRFLTTIIGYSKAYVCRTNNCFGAVVAESTYYETFPIAHSVYLVSKKPDLAILSIVRSMIDWADRIGAIEVIIDSVTDANIEPFARRIGLENQYVQFYRKFDRM